MNSEEFKIIMSGSQKYPLLVKDYCEQIIDESEREETNNFYLTCQNTINFIWKFYNHTQKKPTLFADPYKKISAKAGINKITISRGVINLAKECIPNENTHPNKDLLNKIKIRNKYFFLNLSFSG